MTKARSPSYPSIGLKEAIEKVTLVYSKDYLNAVPKAVIANHMGYKGLSGASLPIIAALSQYGLLEGRGDDTRVSKLALAIIAHEPGSDERFQAIHSAAIRPELFAELFKKFPDGKASDAAVRAYLLTGKFIPAAADTAIRSYRETIELLNSEKEWYSAQNPEVEFKTEMREQSTEETKRLLDAMPTSVERPIQEVFHLPEGTVTITFPKRLSVESYQDLEDQLGLILRRVKRQSGKTKDEAAN